MINDAYLHCESTGDETDLNVYQSRCMRQHRGGSDNIALQAMGIKERDFVAPPVLAASLQTEIVTWRRFGW